MLLRELELQRFCLKIESREVYSYIKGTTKMHTSFLPLEKRLLSGLSAGYSKNRVHQGPDDDGSIILRACLHQLQPQHYLKPNCVFSWLTVVPEGTSIR